MAKIYISSTKDDLLIEREGVKKWLGDNGHEPVDSYAPSSDPVLESCLADIETCQLYLLIQGYRRGFVPPCNNPENIPITHLEFRHAQAKGIPAVVLRTTRPDANHSSLWAPDEMAQVQAFHKEVDAVVRPGQFSNLDELIQWLAIALDQELDKLGISPIVVQLDADLRRASGDLLKWPSTLRDGEWMPPPELDRLRKTFDSEPHSLTLLLGEPGCGKSALLARLGNDLIDQGLAVLGVKADRLPEDVTDAKGLASALHLPQPPLALVRSIARQRPIVVLIDQLDALAELVVQRPERLRVLLDLIRELHGISNVHVLASCRVFEQRHDPALRQLDAETIYLELPEWSLVHSVLQKHDVETSAWNHEMQESLRFPHALDTFLSLLRGTSEPDLAQGFQGLLQQSWERIVIRGDSSGRRRELMLQMAGWMSERETLWLATAHFEDHHTEIQALAREGLLILPEGQGTVGFRHQTWYEFLRARSFLEQGGRLTETVLAGQARLRIRPQLWHALIYLRRTEPMLYTEELELLWQSELRPHLRMLIIEFLGMQQNPLPCEIQLAWAQFDDPWFQPRFLGAAAGSPGWFYALAPQHLPMLMHRSDEEDSLVRVILARALAFDPKAVLLLLDAHWLGNPAHDLQCWRILVVGCGAPQDAHWVDRIQLIIGRTTLAEWAINDAISAVSAVLPEEAPRLLATWLQRQWQKLAAGGEGSLATIPLGAVDETSQVDPKAVRKLLETRDLHDLPAAAEAAPSTFIRSIWPILLNLFKSCAASEHQILVEYCNVRGLLEPWDDEDSRLGHPLLESLPCGISSWARGEPETFKHFVAEYAEIDLMPIQRLFAMGLAECAAVFPAFALDFLCADSRRLKLGPYTDVHKESRGLIDALVPHLDIEQCMSLERAICNWKMYKGHFADDDANIRLRRFKSNRQHRLRLLSAIPAAHLSAAGCRLLKEERRAFPHVDDHDVRFLGVGWVGSPVTTEQMARAAGPDILGLFAELTDETGWDHPRDHMQGGAIQAGRALAGLLESAPDKVVSIVRQLQPGSNEIPVSTTIRDLEKAKLSTDTVFALIADLAHKGFSTREFQEAAADAIRSASSSNAPVPLNLIELLEGWLQSVDPASEDIEERAPEPHGSLLWGSHGLSILPSGNYSLLAALSHACLVAQPPEMARWLDILEVHLTRSESPRVWSTLANRYFSHLRNADHARSQAFLDKLFQAFPSILGEIEGIQLMAHMMQWIAPENAERWLGFMSHSGAKGAQGSAEVLMLRHAWRQDEGWIRNAVERVLNSTDPCDGLQRAGIAHTVVQLWCEPTYRSLGHSYLLRMLCSKEELVLEALGEVFWHRSAWHPDLYTWELLDCLAEHPELLKEGRAEFLPEILESLVDCQPARVARLTQVLIDTVGEKLADTATAWALYTESLIAVALKLQDMTGEHSQRGVELCERLLEFNVPSAMEMVLTLDKRTPNTSGNTRPPRRTANRRRGGRK